MHPGAGTPYILHWLSSSPAAVTLVGWWTGGCRLWGAETPWLLTLLAALVEICWPSARVEAHNFALMQTHWGAVVVPGEPHCGRSRLLLSVALALHAQRFFGSTSQWEAGRVSPLKPWGTLTSPVLGDPQGRVPTGHYKQGNQEAEFNRQFGAICPA